MAKDQESLVGRQIDSYTVIGSEFDSNQHWVGADLLLRIPPVGKFFLNLVTRGQLKQETVRGVVEFGDNLQASMFGPQPDAKDSFVVNDPVLSDAVLERVLGGTVGPDMVDSLWQTWPIESDCGSANLPEAA